MLVVMADGWPDETRVFVEDRWPFLLVDHPRYRILQFLGSGGMGAVYKAEHRLMHRVVALKQIRQDLLDRPEMLERFRAEVRAAARLVHPNIVTAYDAEQAGDAHFLVMEFVEGTTLDQVIRAEGPLSPTLACDHVRQAALGLQHAFEQGMAHRDIKPHNLMRTPQGLIKILDFGLARMATETVPGPATPSRPPDSPRTPSGLTSPGMFLGTLHYVAPEQAADPRQADIRSDIYGLGATLVFLLTGQRPFSEGNVMPKTSSPVRTDRRPMFLWRPDLPNRLLPVLDRMLANNPAERYQTPAAAAEALAGFLRDSGDDGARLVHVAERSQQLRRRIVAFAAALLAAVTMLAGGIVLRVSTSKGTLVIETDDPNIQVTVKQGGELITIVDPATNSQVELKAGEYQLELPSGKSGLSLSTDRFALKRGDREVVRITRERPAAALAQTDTRSTLPLLGVRSARWKLTPPSVPQASPVTRRMLGHENEVTGVAFSPDGQAAFSVSRDGTLRVWNQALGTSVRQFKVADTEIRSIAVASDSSQRSKTAACALGLRDGKVILFFPFYGNFSIPFEGHPERVWSVARAPEGNYVFSGSFDKTVRMWKTPRGQLVREFKGGAQVWCVAVSKDGRYLLSGEGQHGEDFGKHVLRLWDVATGAELRQFEGHLGNIYSVAFLPDGRRAISCAADSTIILWDLDTGRPIRHFKDHQADVNAVAVSPDGKSFLSAGDDGKVIWWNVETGKILKTFKHHAGLVQCVAFSPDGRHYLSGGSDKTVIFDTLPAQE